MNLEIRREIIKTKIRVPCIFDQCRSTNSLTPIMSKFWDVFVVGLPAVAGFNEEVALLPAGVDGAVRVQNLRKSRYLKGLNGSGASISNLL